MPSRFVGDPRRWREVETFTLWPLCPRGSSYGYLLKRRPGGPHTGLEVVKEWKNLCPFNGFNPCLSVTILTELYLHFHGWKSPEISWGEVWSVCPMF
jgi:hypothetical protein